MTSEEKAKKIEREVREMYKTGELQKLLSSNLDVETLRFLGKVKDLYIQEDQEKIISEKEFKI